MIIARTPFRISFFGGGTDYPQWYRQHGGAVLATTIDKYCYLTVRYLPPFFEHRTRVVYSKIENVNSADEITHPSVRATLKFLKINRGVEIHHDGDLPARSGMGSSSSFTVGLLQALHALQGRMVSKSRLASESIHIEQEVLRETVGSQDQVMAAHGGFNHVRFHIGGELDVQPLLIPRQRLLELNDHLMLFYTGIVRTASDVAGAYVGNLSAQGPLLRTLSQLVDEAIALLSSRQDITGFGKLLHEAWVAKSSLSDAISNRAIDLIYDAARTAGANGGKLLGAGGGGFLLLFAPPARQARIRRRLAQYLHVPFHFEHAGSQIVFFDPESDYAAEERQRDRQVIQPFRELPPVEAA